MGGGTKRLNFEILKRRRDGASAESLGRNMQAAHFDAIPGGTALLDQAAKDPRRPACGWAARRASRHRGPGSTALPSAGQGNWRQPLTLITSQLPVKAWHTDLGDPTLADAILDRVVHSSHKIELKGTRSMRDGDAATAQ